MTRFARLAVAFTAALLVGGIGTAVAQGEVDALVDTFNRGGWVDSGAGIVSGPLAEAVDRVGTRACFRIGDSAQAGRCRCVERIAGRAEDARGKVLTLEFGEEHECGRRPPGRQDLDAALQELVGRYPLRVVSTSGGCYDVEAGTFAVTSAAENGIALSLNGTPVRAGFNWQDRSFRARVDQEGTQVELSGRFTRQTRAIELSLEVGFNLAGRCTITFAGSKPAPELAGGPPQPAASGPGPATAPATGADPPAANGEAGPIAEALGEWLDWLDGLEGMISTFALTFALGAGAGFASSGPARKQKRRSGGGEDRHRLERQRDFVNRMIRALVNAEYNEAELAIHPDQWAEARELGQRFGAPVGELSGEANRQVRIRELYLLLEKIEAGLD